MVWSWQKLTTELSLNYCLGTPSPSCRAMANAAVVFGKSDLFNFHNDVHDEHAADSTCPADPVKAVIDAKEVLDSWGQRDEDLRGGEVRLRT